MRTDRLTFAEGCNRLLCGFGTQLSWSDGDTHIVLLGGKCVQRGTSHSYDCDCGCKLDDGWTLKGVLREPKPFIDQGANWKFKSANSIAQSTGRRTAQIFGRRSGKSYLMDAYKDFAIAWNAEADL